MKRQLNTSSRERLWRDVEDLSKFGAIPAGGVSRATYSFHHRAAIDWLGKRMESAGMTVTVDGAGNLVGRLEGSHPGPAVAAGSHIDSVPAGGRFDGAAGVVGALEAVRILQDEGFRPRRPIEVLAFAEEEGARFGMILLGSKAMAGLVDRQQAEAIVGSDGVSLSDALRHWGSNLDSFLCSKRSPAEVAAFVELHVEQGGVLDSEGLQIGVVTHIVGLRHQVMRFVGQVNHAGTTPMHLRQDALLAAARVVVAVRQLVREHGTSDAVSTVGFIKASPNVINVIAGEAAIGIDVRDTDRTSIDRLATLISREAADACTEEKLLLQVQTLSDIPPVSCDDGLVEAVTDACWRLGFSWRRMVSGALHDSCSMSSIAPVAMVFVPSIGGRSHCPDEYTPPDDLWRGAMVLSEVLRGLAS